ncbi:MAG: M23 family metallopeptidase, partial [Chloroflexi bacterium]
MNRNENTIWQRFRGHLAVLLLILLFLAGWRFGFGRSESEDAGRQETAVESTPTQLTAPTRQTEAETVVAGIGGELPIVTDTSLMPAPNPHTYQGPKPNVEYQTYVVKRGDTPISIAEKFGIKPETILGGNPQLSQESSLLQTGVEIKILPIDGVLHEVQPGDTLEGLAARYGVPMEDIIAYKPNNLEFPYRLYPGTQIIIPGAVRDVFVWTPPDLSEVVGRSSFEGRGVTPVIVGTGTFIFPVNSRNFTQYFWYGHQAVDIALPEGSPVYASDTGTVTYAGWNTYGYGNLIV